jgi:putative heme-binding domain-containing protein
VYTSSGGIALRGVPQGDLTKLRDSELISLQAHPNEWFARHSRRLLQERAAAGELATGALAPLHSLLLKPAAGLREVAAARLRALFTLHAAGAADEPLLLALLAAPEEELRAWAALLSVESRTPSAPLIAALTKAATNDKSSFVRLHLACALQRIPLDQRWEIAGRLLSNIEDSADPYLPLMYWYAVEPLVPREVRRAIELLPRVQIPLVRQFLTRRILTVYDEAGGASGSAAWVLDELLRIVANAADDSLRADVLGGLCDALRGRRKVQPPAGWRAAKLAVSGSQDRALTRAAREAGVIFGDQIVIAGLQEVFFRLPRNVEAEREALALLATHQDPAFALRLLRLIRRADRSDIRPEAIRALGGYDLPDIPPALVALYPSLTPAERLDVIQTLTARPAFALFLLDAVEQGRIPRQDVSALVIRQLQALDDTAVSERLRQVWGEIRPASAEKRQRIAQLKSQLTPDVLASADLSRGRAIFAKSCATCHKLFDDGSQIGPELTGSQRHNLDYVLDNVLDPSAIVPREYKINIFRLADGRVVQGMLLEETPHTITVQSANETIRVPATDVEARKESPLSMMPEGLFDRLATEELRDLVAYLASPQQVPLPAAAP